MRETRIVVNRAFTKGEIDERIYSSFVEHMGRVVYSGIYEPGHPTADEEGFRQDVLELVKRMGVTGVRYPGGNFVSCYDWRDSVGPREERPRRLEIAWRAIETNEFGTDEFIHWAKKAKVEPIFAVNLGTKGIENAVSFVEYCNIAGGTLYSELRKKHGAAEPYGVRTWCLGNEMDGDWQIGHKTAEEYGRLAEETAKAMKQVDPQIRLVSCGSSKSDMQTYPVWEADTLMHTYPYVDYISLHQYYGGQELGTGAFLAQSLDMEKYIRTVISACDYVKAMKRSDKTLYISFDEWGVWSMPDTEVAASVDERPWQIAPHLSEQIYTMEDALLFACMMLNFLKYADRVKIACQSLLANISAAIMTEKGGDAWVQPIYYPFSQMANYGKGVVLRDVAQGPAYEVNGRSVPYVDEAVVYHRQAKELVLFAVNRCEREAAGVELEIQGFGELFLVEHSVTCCADKKATNETEHDRIHPVTVNGSQIRNKVLTASLPPLSWNMIRIRCEAQEDDAPSEI